MNNILILDTETTGLDPRQGHKVIEVAAVLYNVPHKTILQKLSTLLPVDKNDAEKVNKISAASSQIMQETSAAILAIIDAAKCSDFVVAHNAEFDKQWMESITMGDVAKKKWICSASDFTWPDMRGNRRLTDIAMHLGVPVVSAHRALTDCLLLAECFNRISDLGDRMDRAKHGKDTYVAVVSYDDRRLAAENGFVWDKIVARQWASKLSEEEKLGLPFPIKKVSV